MSRHLNWTCLALFLAVPALARAQVPPEKALPTFTVAEGLELSLWASEPLFVNPTSMDIDHQGRVWVCESVNYRCRLRGQPLRRKEGDRILILEDSKGTGKADRATVFYQSPELLAPLGIAVARDPVGPGYKVYVCQSPDILLFEDRDGDGRADGPPRKLLTGFRGIDHDHGVHGILIGPDGKLYFTVGDSGVQGLQSSDGKGRQWTSNSTDCRAGTVWRCDLDGKNLELIAHNFRNNYEACVDSFGTIFLSDNDDDGNRQTRLCYVMPGGNYGYHPRGRGQTHWHEEQPGVVPKILRTGFGSPTGICVYEGTLLPKKYQGQLLHADAGPREIRCFHLRPSGAGYDVEKELLVTSKDNWFRPSDVCVAPDGSVFIADWYDPGVGGHGIADLTRGRIYRLAPKGSRPSVPKVDLESREGILRALGSPNRAVRYRAMAQLQRLDAREASAILRAGFSPKALRWLRARCLWQLGLPGKRVLSDAWADLNVAAVKEPDPLFRLLSLRFFKECLGRSDAFVENARYISADPVAAVRREVLLSLRDIDAAKAAPLIYDLAKKYDGKDRFYLCALGIAVGHHDQKRRQAILADFAKHFPEWNDRVADLVWELRPPGALTLLKKSLADAKTPAGQRARMIDILTGYQEQEAGRALLEAFRAGLPPEARDRALASLKVNLAGRWRDLRRSKELQEAIDALLQQPATRPSALALIGIAERVESAGAVHELARNAGQPAEVRAAAVRTLGQLPSRQAIQLLQGMLRARDERSAPAVLKSEAALALGAQAARDSRPAEARAAQRALQELVRSKGLPVELRLAAVEGLAAGQQGSAWLLAVRQKGELPGDLVAHAGRLLRNSPFRNVQGRARALFPAPGKLDPKRLPPLAALARRPGNAERGKQLLAASLKSDLQCLKCHTVRGIGGAVGPDLSMIGKKASRENLLESILQPSKAVAHEYVTWQIETRKGLSLTGLLVEETPEHVVLRDGNGKDTRVLKKDLEARTRSPHSLMPEDLVASMTEADVLDLTEYLLTLKTPALAVPSWQLLGPLDNSAGDAGLDRDFGPEKGIDRKAQYPGKGGKIGWRQVRTDGQGYVDLHALFGPASRNIVSYLYTEIESPAEQEATILLGTDDGCRLWVNGRKVFGHNRHEAALPERDRVKVRLKKGKNTVLLKINNGEGPHGFYFTVMSEQELKRVAPE